jgi:hypothetical protein
MTQTNFISQGYYWNGTTWIKATGDVTNGLDVDVTRVQGTVTVDTELPAGLVKNADNGLEVHLNNGSGGGGVEYNEGDTDAVITGGVVMWEDTSDTIRATSAAKPLPVNVVAGGTAGTQYTEADVDATITGTALMWEDTSDTLRAASVAKPLPVAQQGSVAVTGTFWQATQPVSGTFWQATQPVSGPLTDAQLRAAVVPVSDGGGSLTVDGTFWQATQPVSGTVTTSPPANASTNVAQVAGTATDVNSGVKSAGTQRIVIATDQPQLTNALKVDGSAVTQPVSGTFWQATQPVSGTFWQATQPVSIATNTPVGNVAHDGVDSGAPLKIGTRARSADITAVAADDRSDALSTLLGKLMVMPYALPGATVQGTGNKTDTSDLALVAAPGAGIRTYITHITITNAHASVGTKVVLKDGSTIIWRGYADALGGGVCTALPTPLRLTANTALNGAAITTGADVDFTVVGFTAAE